MPSTTSSWVSRPFASSTVITPSLPTFSMASAIMSPMVLSPLADTAPTWAISSLPLVDFDCFLSSSTTAATARSIPRFKFIGSCPAATILAPSVKMERASTVAVVVPSPATSEVFEATSFTIWAPMFSNLSSSSISLATVTPSLVTVGAPKLFSSTTLRPFGPSVTVTASARTLTPLRIFSRASCENLTNLAGMLFISPIACYMHVADDLSSLRAQHLAFKHAENVVFTKNEVLLPFKLNLATSVFAEQNTVAGLHVWGEQLPVLGHFTFADRHHSALLRLFLGGVGNNNPSLGLSSS